MTKPIKDVSVVAIPSKDASGNVTYQTTFTPDTVTIKKHQTVINYQIVGPTPPGVTFDSVSIIPLDQNQLSTPSIEQNGKLVTLTDANTVQMSFNLTFYFKDSDGVSFNVDPSIDNEPPPEM